MKQQQGKHTLKKILKSSHIYALRIRLRSWKRLFISCLQLNPAHAGSFTFGLHSVFQLCILSRQSSLETMSDLRVRLESRPFSIRAWSGWNSQSIPKAETQEHGMNWQMLFLKNVTEGGRVALCFFLSTARPLEDSYRRWEIRFTCLSQTRIS